MGSHGAGTPKLSWLHRAIREAECMVRQERNILTTNHLQRKQFASDDHGGSLFHIGRTRKRRAEPRKRWPAASSAVGSQIETLILPDLTKRMMPRIAGSLGNSV